MAKSSKTGQKGVLEFRKYMREAFSTGTSPHQSTSGSVVLDVEPGPWRAVQRSAWFLCYRYGSKLHQRNRVTLTAMAPGGVSRFYYSEGSATHLPRTARPITCRTIGESRWTQTKHRVVGEEASPMPLLGMVTT